MKWNNLKQGAAVFSLLMIVGSPNVQANAVATSIIEIKNLLAKRVDNGLVFTEGTDFTFSSSSNNADVSASFVGGASAADGGSAPPGVPLDYYACVGACAGGAAPEDNTFDSHYPVPGFGQYVASDALLDGSIAQLAGAPPTTGANGRLLNEVSLTNSSEGSGQSNVGTLSQLVFTATDATEVEINFNATIFLQALLSDDANTPPSAADASIAWTISLDRLLTPAERLAGEIDQSFEWAPNGAAGGIVGGTEFTDSCNLQASVGTIDATFPDVESCSGAFRATTFTLIAGARYLFQVEEKSEADAKVEVPEPSVTFLLGAGLLAMVFAARRRRLKFEA